MRVYLRTAMALVVWFSVALFMGYCNELADRWGEDHVAAEKEALRVYRQTHYMDAIPYLVGFPLIEHGWLPDTFVLLCGCTMLLTMARTTNKPNTASLELFCQRVAVFCVCHVVVMVLRCSTVLVSVSRPSPRCNLAIPGPGFMNNNCYDMVFSGHTSWCVLTATFAAYHSPSSLATVWCVFIGVFGAAVNVLVGDHYTVDVLLGVYIPMLVFLAVHPSLLPFQATRSGLTHSKHS